MSARRYRTLGYVLESERELPLDELVGGGEDPAVRCVVREPRAPSEKSDDGAEVLHDVLDEPGGLRLRVTRDARGMTVRYPPWTLRLSRDEDAAGPMELSYSEGRSAPGVTEDRAAALVSLLERVVLPIDVLLHRPDTVVLHGNAVVLDGRAWVFLGESGAGKSTTALELLQRGALLLADDRVPVDVATLLVSPGPSSLRLRDEGSAGSGVGVDGKRALHVASQGRAHAPHPLAGLVFLRPVVTPAEGDDVVLEPLEPRALVLELLRQSFSLTRPPASVRAEQFRRLSALSRVAPGYRCSFVHGSPELRAQQMNVLYALLCDRAGHDGR